MAVNTEIFISAEGLLKRTQLSVIHQGVPEARSKVSGFLESASFHPEVIQGLRTFQTICQYFFFQSVHFYMYTNIHKMQTQCIYYIVATLTSWKITDMKAFLLY